MKVRIVERPIVEEARAQHLAVGSVHDVVKTEFRNYSPEMWPNALSSNIVRVAGANYVSGARVRLVTVGIPDPVRLVLLLPHEYREDVAPAAATDNPALRQSVTERVEASIRAFARARAGQQFHAKELHARVEADCGAVAPGSPDRILRDMRQRGELLYECVSQPKSLYQFAADPLTVTAK